MFLVPFKLAIEDGVLDLVPSSLFEFIWSSHLKLLLLLLVKGLILYTKLYLLSSFPSCLLVSTVLGLGLGLGLGLRLGLGLGRRHEALLGGRGRGVRVRAKVTLSLTLSLTLTLEGVAEVLGLGLG